MQTAENYYGADYPEDEVDSDDEYDRGVYKYRQGSDSEEFGDDGATFSDDDEDALRYPWKRHPWMPSRGMRSGVEDETEGNEESGQ